LFLDHQESSLYVAAGKGGISLVYGKTGPEQGDFGWRIKTGSRVAVTHWLNQEYAVDVKDEDDDIYIFISGEMTTQAWMTSTPFKHLLLKALSFTLGCRLIPLLKKKTIFGKKGSGVYFTRTLSIGSKQVGIKDTFSGLKQSHSPVPAPHYSLRHVASAYRYSNEELCIPVERELIIHSEGKHMETQFTIQR
jgi:hypothetical protein